MLINKLWVKKLLLFALLGVFVISLTSCEKSNKTDLKEFTSKLVDDWKLYPAEKIDAQGAEISKAGYSVNDWYTTKVPSTVMAALIENGVYKDVFVGDNLEKIDRKQFENPWWYRKEFLPEKGKNVDIVFEGINYKANIWLNGKLLADDNRVEGVYRTYRFDISDKLVDGKNCVAVEIIPPKRGDLTIGFVDWNPTPNDNNMGLWRGVQLEYSQTASLKHSAVFSEVNTETLKSADLQIVTTLKNNNKEKKSFTVNAEIEGVKVSKTVELEGEEEKVIKLDKNEFSQLTFNNPRLWWPNGLGEANLYNMNISVEADGKLSDAEKIRFGIRKIEDYINEEGHRGYKVNGKKVLIKSAGWVDDLFLNDSDEKVRAQMQYVKHMNLNSVRLEGFWGKNKTLYECADEYGLLLMVGLSCQWEWTGYCGRPQSEDPAEWRMLVTSNRDIEVQGKGYRDQVMYLRNHPSVFVYVFGSDMLPTTEFEQALYDYIKPIDNSRPFLTSCKYQNGEHFNVSEISGPVAVKMLGPYGYVPPKYWFEDTKAGGAYGFNTETGPGPQVPPIESIKKMIPEKDLWPVNKMWDYHNGRGAFNTLSRYIAAFDKRYGKSDSVEDFAQFSQISNYEAMRAMYEAFQVNRPNATGVVQWMLNSAWPEFYWQLYDYYLMPNGAFYATQDGCRPLNIIYNYKDQDIYVANEQFNSVDNLTAKVKVFDINSKVLFEKEVPFSVEENISKKIIDMPEIGNLSETYFIDLRLTNSSGKELADNFYWLSKNDDVLDYKKTQWFITPIKKHANLTQIRTMEKVTVEASPTFKNGGDKTVATVNFTNKSDKIAFGIEALIVDKNTGNSILPVFLSDNYFSLLPGETKTVTAEIFNKDINGKTPELKYSGINLN